MDRLVTHIEFLLHEHNCVIIPGLGGFVVNITYSYRDEIALYYPPVCDLVFNRELTYNDGLLAESFMKTYNITFESAMLKIEEAVSDVKQQLREKQSVDLNKLGSFILFEDNRFIYKTGDFIRPTFFGLTKARLKPLIQLQKPASIVEATTDFRSDKHINIKRSSRSVTVAAVAMIAVLFVMFFLPVRDIVSDRQSAKMIYEAEWLRPRTSFSSDNYVEKNIKEDIVFPASEILDNIEDDPAYYIIMGVFRGEISATRLSESLKAEGFTGTNWLERPDRIDVYAASFNNIIQAEDYLRKVHKQFPNHSDAWILKW